MFEAMNRSIQEDAVRLIMRARFQQDESLTRQSVARNVSYSKAEEEPAGFAQPEKSRPEPASEVKQAPVRRDVDKVGRNDPCPCGSGKKYKNCHGR